MIAPKLTDRSSNRVAPKSRRAKYEETMWDIKKKVEKSTGTPAEKLQIFHHKKELLDEEYKDKTLDEMNLHTGFSLLAYDLVRHPKNELCPIHMRHPRKLPIFSSCFFIL